MRKVITYISAVCDDCGKDYTEFEDQQSPIETVGWTWQSETYELDLCADCRASVLTVPLGTVMKWSRPQLRPKKKPKHGNPGGKGVPKKDHPRWDKWKGEDERYHCPKCEFNTASGRGLAMHHSAMHDGLLDPEGDPWGKGLS